MNRILLSAMVSSALLSGGAIAADSGTITFTGAITDSTCDVSVNGGGASGTVTLPTVSAASLSTMGQTTGTTRFTLDLSNCAGGTLNTAKAYFQNGSSVSSAGRLINQASTSPATGVTLQLLDGQTGNAINVGDSAQNTGGFVDITGAVSGTVTLPYSVEYYAETASAAGAVSSMVTYNLNYQ